MNAKRLKPGSMWSPSLPESQKETEDLRYENNPDREPVGIFTGRCRHCHSSDLWDDNLAYGCNCCGALLGSNT